jgi:hypothetical protein
MDDACDRSWRRGATIATIESRWLRVIAEHYTDDAGQPLEYWRIERASSVIIIPLAADAILVPPARFRPGVTRCTRDLPGGRLAVGSNPLAMVAPILARELGVGAERLVDATLLDTRGWMVDSAVSDQRVYGVVATLLPGPVATGVEHIPADAAAITALIDSLECLQCRAVLTEWRRQTTWPEPRGRA